MPRKSDPAYKTESSVFATRLREIMRERGENQTTLADKISAQYVTIQRQTISLYMSGQSKPDTERLTAIAKVLEVSADWLLGLSNHKSTNFSVRRISDITGLSEETIEFLVLRRKHLDSSYMEALNDFLEPVYLQELMAFLFEIRGSINTLKRMIVAVNEEVEKMETESEYERKNNQTTHDLSLGSKAEELEAEIKNLRLHRFETAEYLSGGIDWAYATSEIIEDAWDAIGMCGQYITTPLNSAPPISNAGDLPNQHSARGNHTE